MPPGGNASFGGCSWIYSRKEGHGGRCSGGCMSGILRRGVCAIYLSYKVPQ